MRTISGITRSRTSTKRPIVKVVPCQNVRDHARVSTLRPHTKIYGQPARERLGIAVSRAREAMGHQFRPSFVASASGVGYTSLVKLETGKPVGPAVYEAVARALSGWTEDTPRIILEGGPIPPTLAEVSVEPEPTDINEEMLESLRQMRDLLDRTPMDGEEALSFMDRLADNWQRQETDAGRYVRTLRLFTEETERDRLMAERNRRTPNE